MNSLVIKFIDNYREIYLPIPPSPYIHLSRNETSCPPLRFLSLSKRQHATSCPFNMNSYVNQSILPKRTTIYPTGRFSVLRYIRLLWVVVTLYASYQYQRESKDLTRRVEEL